MGLDAYAFVTEETIEGEVDFESPGRCTTEIKYWRQFHELNDWFCTIYLSKGGQRNDFNCVNVLLTVDDLQALKVAAPTLHNKPWLGKQRIPDLETITDIINFCNDAIREINDGNKVFYNCWY